MITGFFLKILYVLISFFVGLLPVAVFPTEITVAINTVWYYINGFSWLFPLGTLLSVITVATLFPATIIFWRYGHLVLRYLRGR